MSDRIDIAIIGAGVIGLAIAAQVAREDREVYVLERNETFGRETSSRNSGVIHSGIYYPEGSLRAKMCVAGNRMLYGLCEKHGIGHKRLGKLVVATSHEQTGELQVLLERGRGNGATGLRMLSKQEMNRLEPNVAGVAALLSPATGIIDAHGLMRYYISQATSRGARIAYKSEVTGIARQNNEYLVTIEDSTGRLSLPAQVVINCAGLHSAAVAEMAGIDLTTAGYRLYYCKGEYFSVGNGKNRLVKRLIYPVPPVRLAASGIHITLDIDGRMRLGPSDYYVDKIDYAIDSRHKQLFYDSAKKLLPAIDYEDLEPEMAGIRPKLQGHGQGIRDFAIRDESDKGLPRLINLIGIESPGLTASPAIAEYVGNMVDRLLKC